MTYSTLTVVLQLYEELDLIERVYDELMALGLSQPHIGHAFEFSQLPDAIKLFQSGATMGKVVVLCDQ